MTTKSWFKCSKFIKDASKGPDINFLVVRNSSMNFWRYVDECADNSIGQRHSVVDFFGDAEVTNLKMVF